MRIACYSDCHGLLPPPVECDLALIAGDICPNGTWTNQLGFLQGPFTAWISQFKYSMFIAGNHDWIFQTNPEFINRFPWNTRYLHSRMFDPGHPMSGWLWPKSLKVFGTPWSLTYGRWAFMTDESGIMKGLEGGESADILISHTAPYGYGDPGDNEEHVGSKYLTVFIAIYQPKLVICGHLHDGRGVYKIGRTTVVNAAMANFNDRFEITGLRPPIIVTMDENHEIVDVEV